MFETDALNTLQVYLNVILYYMHGSDPISNNSLGCIKAKKLGYVNWSPGSYKSIQKHNLTNTRHS